MPSSSAAAFMARQALAAAGVRKNSRPPSCRSTNSSALGSAHSDKPRAKGKCAGMPSSATKAWMLAEGGIMMPKVQLTGGARIDRAESA